MDEEQEGNFSVEMSDHLWITMPDGIRLAARLWRPVTSDQVPVIFEFIPYRKADMVRARDERNHPFFAANGFACMRVDMRGSGDSEGHMPDMYTHKELSDARLIIDWLSKQSWCNGRVGMFGTSWGGTASLQAGLDAHPALKAIIAVCATHDRFEDDIHYMGGCVLTDTFEWGATLPSILGSPPTPHAGGNWMEIWKDRVENLSFPLEKWLSERERGHYWRHGSIIHESQKLTVPVLAVGGWSDRYSNSVMSLAQARPDKVWGIVGPWGHHYPDHGHPGPGISFQKVALEWWNAMLGRPDPSAPDWPPLQIWLREFEYPKDVIHQRKGRWIASEPPFKENTDSHYYLSDGRLGLEAGQGPWPVPDDLKTGLMSGDTGYFGRYGGLPLDQDADDRRSLTFETGPLAEDTIIYGKAAITLDLEVGSKAAQLCLRLNDVAPDGTSSRITYAIRNLTLNDELDHPGSRQIPGQIQINISFHSTAYQLNKGHKLKLSVSSSYWPLIWPEAEEAHISIQTGRLYLPLYEGTPDDIVSPLPEPVDLPTQKTHEVLSSPRLERWNHTEGGKIVTGWRQPELWVYYKETGTVFSYSTRVEQSLKEEDRLSALYRIDHRMEFKRQDGTAQVCCWLEASSDKTDFHIEAKFVAVWNGRNVGEKIWKHQLKRH